MNSRTKMSDISDGASNTILLGERSGEIKGGYYRVAGTDFFDSAWIGIVASKYSAWSVVAWTGEGPKNTLHTYAQFNSAHAGLTVFGFCDGSTRTIDDDIDWDVFREMGSIAPKKIK